MSVSDWSGSLLEWERELGAWKARLDPVFGRRELRETGRAFLDGLLSGIARKTGWMMAEQAGLSRPWRMQALLGRSRWDADALRDEVRRYAVEALGCPDGVLVVDETGFVKKGRHSVGIARQYTGTAGRVENSQVGVFLAYAGRLGQALIDRRLYLPQDWAADGARRAKTQVPAEVAFATKPALAREMIAAALDADMPCAFVLADAVYGSDSRLRRMLEGRGQSYVLAVRGNHTLRFPTVEGLIQTDPETIADDLEDGAWAAHAAGEGSKGPRLYDWVRIALSGYPEDGRERWLLIRRSRNDPDKRAYYLVFCHAGTTLAELAGVAGLRWTIEECFQRTKSDLGLDHCEARSWHGWHRHISLVMAAAAFLAKLAADLRNAASSKRNETSPDSSIAA
ncbi:MAG: IS701 family transposase [Chloroflexi bacterium]|nr:IS701 family transposase [Chloroflexota bacterium]